MSPSRQRNGKSSESAAGGTNPSSSTCKLILHSPLPKRLALWLPPELEKMCILSGLLGYCHLLGASQNSYGEQETSHHWTSPWSASLGHSTCFRWPRGVHAGTTSTADCSQGQELPAPHQSHTATDHVKDYIKPLQVHAQGWGFFGCFTWALVCTSSLVTSCAFSIFITRNLHFQLFKKVWPWLSKDWDTQMTRDHTNQKSGQWLNFLMLASQVWVSEGSSWSHLQL